MNRYTSVTGLKFSTITVYVVLCTPVIFAACPCLLIKQIWFFSAILQLYFAFIFLYRKFAFSRYLTSNSIKYRFLRYSSLNKNFFISASGHLGSYRYFNKLNANQTLISSSRATGLLYSKHTKFAQHTEQNGKEGELIDFLFTASDIVLMT